MALDTMYASPKKRGEKQKMATLKAARRGASTDGGAARIPVAEKRGCITDGRFFENLAKLYEKQQEAVEKKRANGKHGRDAPSPSPAAPNVFYDVEDGPKPPPDIVQQRVQFVVKLQSNAPLQPCRVALGVAQTPSTCGFGSRQAMGDPWHYCTVRGWQHW